MQLWTVFGYPVKSVSYTYCPREHTTNTFKKNVFNLINENNFVNENYSKTD